MRSQNASGHPPSKALPRDDDDDDHVGEGAGAPGGGGGQTGKSRQMSGSTAVSYAKAHLLDPTGQPCEAVSSLNRTRDGWRVVLEVVELERIPQTTDILASYQVELDEDGELMGYQRINRYYRNAVDGEQ